MNKIISVYVSVIRFSLTDRRTEMENHQWGRTVWKGNARK